MTLESLRNDGKSISYDSLRANRELTRRIQQALMSAGVPVKGGADGLYGANTKESLELFAKAHGLKPGIIDRQFAEALLRTADIPPAVTRTIGRLGETDYADCARILDCHVAAVRAVVEVESSGGGFLPDGRPKILFEAHYFHRLTGGRYSGSHPHLSAAKWDRKLYKGGAREWDRMEEAKALDHNAALQSASWGLFQIMGANFKACGFQSVEDFAAAMEQSEGAQLRAFVNFIRSNKLDGHLRKQDWAAFARGYNGPAFAQNQYDTKLATAFKRYA